MHEGVSIDPRAVYDNAAIDMQLNVSAAALRRARQSGELKYAKLGQRTLYLGQWILDWLEYEALTEQST